MSAPGNRAGLNLGPLWEAGGRWVGLNLGSIGGRKSHLSRRRATCERPPRLAGSPLDPYAAWPSLAGEGPRLHVVVCHLRGSVRNPLHPGRWPWIGAYLRSCGSRTPWHGAVGSLWSGTHCRPPGGHWADAVRSWTADGVRRFDQLYVQLPWDQQALMERGAAIGWGHGPTIRQRWRGQWQRPQLRRQVSRLPWGSAAKVPWIVRPPVVPPDPDPEPQRPPGARVETESGLPGGRRIWRCSFESWRRRLLRGAPAT